MPKSKPCVVGWEIELFSPCHFLREGTPIGSIMIRRDEVQSVHRTSRSHSSKPSPTKP